MPLKLYLFIGLCLIPAWLGAGEPPRGLELQLTSLGSSSVQVQVQNNGNESQYLLNLFDVPYHMLVFKIENEKGEKVKFRGSLVKAKLLIENVIYVSPRGFFGRRMDLRDLKPSFVKEGEKYKAYYDLVPGKYMAKAVYDTRGMKNQFEGIKLWDGRLVSNEIQFTVSAGN
ncbi:MAG: hypothetical protein OEZ68_20555 [Gammaproteobacteria bacterium]|nr:hypothetical protein [Gammaproteobacteria bacterium]MDH5803196.1 hypothetical protein [Gammaproteobacteria bacterium]